MALDSVETPFGKADEVLGGSATFFSAAACHLTPVQLVGVVGDDYPIDKLDTLAKRGVDLTGLERAEGRSFRWRGRYRHDLNVAETLETHLGVFSNFSPKIPAQFRKKAGRIRGAVQRADAVPVRRATTPAIARTEWTPPAENWSKSPTLTVPSRTVPAPPTTPDPARNELGENFIQYTARIGAQAAMGGPPVDPNIKCIDNSGNKVSCRDLGLRR